MISRQNLISQLGTNTNFHAIPLPSGKFTQPNTQAMIQMEKDRLDSLRDDLAHNTSLANVAGQLPPEVVQEWLKPRHQRQTQNTTQSPSHLSQSVINSSIVNSGNNMGSGQGLHVSAASMLAGLVPTNNSYSGMNTTNDVAANMGSAAYGSYLSFKENESIPIPEVMLGLFTHNRYQKNGMLYGMRNPDSFYKCLILLRNAEYIMNTKYKRTQDVMTMKTSFSNVAKIVFENLNYIEKLSLAPSSGQALADAITKENHTEKAIFQFCADYLEHPIFIVNMEDKKIWHYKCLDTSNTKDTNTGYLIVDYHGCYLPFYHADTAHMVTLSLETIKRAGFRECNLDSPDSKYPFYTRALHVLPQQQELPSSNEGTSESEGSGTTNKITLDTLSREKLADLQVKAKQLGIDIRKQNKKGNMVNKLKAELWADLDKIINGTEKGK